MKNWKVINNERGVALLMVLLISTITLAVTTTMLYMLVQSTKYSGLSKRYATASEAGKAAVNLYTDFIAFAKDKAYREELANSNLDFWPSSTDTVALEREDFKITNDWEYWDKTKHDATLLMDRTDVTTYDAKFVLDKYEVLSKIVYTFKGNTRAKEASSGGTAKAGWKNTCVIHCQGGEGDTLIPPIYSAYIIEVEAVNTQNPDDRARYSVLFQF